MRIGEIFQVVKSGTSDNRRLILENEVIFNGQAYRILNFGKIRKSIEALYVNSLTPIQKAPELDSILEKYNNNDVIDISLSEYKIFENYISQVNQNLPIVMSVLEKFTQEQHENTLNIKLPGSIERIGDLDEFSKRIKKIFQKFGVVEQNIRIVGFDRGSMWLEILLENVDWIVPSIIACIGIAVEVIMNKKHMKEDAKNNTTINVNVINNFYSKDKKITEEIYIQQASEEEIRQKVEQHVSLSETKIGGKETEESINMLIQATKELVKEFEKGTEFHLSYNPPKYVNRDGDNVLKIDYSSIPKEIAENDNDKRELGDGQ